MRKLEKTLGSQTDQLHGYPFPDSFSNASSSGTSADRPNLIGHPHNPGTKPGEFRIFGY